MTTLAQSAAEQEVRHFHLMRLHHELQRAGVHVQVRRRRRGRPRLRLLSSTGWAETVLCAGAEGAYAFVTIHGRLLGRATDVRYVAATLTWMIERNHR